MKKSHTLPKKLGIFTTKLDRALPGKHTKKLYDSLKKTEAKIQSCMEWRFLEANGLMNWGDCVSGPPMVAPIRVTCLRSTLEATSGITDQKINPMDYWRKHRRWPKESFKQDDQAREDFKKDFEKDSWHKKYRIPEMNMNHVLARSRHPLFAVNNRKSEADSTTPKQHDTQQPSRNSSATGESVPTAEYQEWPLHGFFKRIRIGKETIFNLDFHLDPPKKLAQWEIKAISGRTVLWVPGDVTNQYVGAPQGRQFCSL